MKPIRKLLKLTKENPELGVVALTHDIEEENNVGRIEDVEVQEYIRSVNGKAELIIKSDFDGAEGLERYWDSETFDMYSDTPDSEMERIYNSLPWQKAIFVYVGPDYEKEIG